MPLQELFFGRTTCGIFVLILVVVELHRANAIRGGAFSRSFTGSGGSTKPGICAGSVAIHGYKCDEFVVTTEDGYILSLQRISGGQQKPPVIVQHGLFVDGVIWLLNLAEQNLPLILADNGFEVWISNTRGTKFSRKHTSLQPGNVEFWNWSLDELAKYDLPAIFDFVKFQTGQKVNYVGHSLGTLIVLASLLEGRLVGKLNSAALLSPIAFFGHIKSELAIFAARAFLGEIATSMGISEFNPVEEPVVSFLHSVCFENQIDCYDLLSSFTGKNCCLNSSTVDLFLRNGPQSTSIKNIVHLAQTIRNGTVVTKYDYDSKEENVKHYGVEKPPTYNLSKIPHDLPLFISYGGQDTLCDAKDVRLLLDSFQEHDDDKLSVQFVQDYAHADYTMGVTAKDIVYNDIVKFFLRHLNS